MIYFFCRNFKRLYLGFESLTEVKEGVKTKGRKIKTGQVAGLLPCQNKDLHIPDGYMEILWLELNDPIGL